MNRNEIQRRIRREKRIEDLSRVNLEQDETKIQSLDSNFERLKSKLRKKKNSIKESKIAEQKRQKLAKRMNQAKNSLRKSDWYEEEKPKLVWNGNGKDFGSRSSLCLMLEECFEMSLNVKELETPPSCNNKPEILQSTCDEMNSMISDQGV